MTIARSFRIDDLAGRTVVITGGSGGIGRHLVAACAACGANVAMLARNLEAAERVAAELEPEARARTLVVTADVTDRAALDRALDRVLGQFGRVDALVNSAGGNTAAASAGATSFFDLPVEALRDVVDLNLLGTVLPSQVFGRVMVGQGDGVILNITSVAADRPLTRVVTYAAAKAAVTNFTQWLAVHMAREYSPRIRVNAIAPGFILTKQNEFLLMDAVSGALTPRGEAIMAHTPMRRLGAPEDLVGAVLWLLSPASAFVTGAVIHVDGGFSAFSGV